jgi:TerC family integral membrane protein
MRESIGSLWLWIGFTLLILALLALDLGLLHRRAREVGARHALFWSLGWIGLSLSFNVVVYLWFGADSALEFLTGYLIEKALSVDNIFVFLALFSYFSVPAQYQQRVLFWGVLGAIVLRIVFILLGSALLHTFHWLAIVLGLFLVYTGIRFLRQIRQVRPEQNPVVRLFRRAVPTTQEYHGPRFMVRLDGRWMATPLLVVLVAIETTDIVFAMDSIPAIFAVTDDPFIVYTSNIFAILGLRALYFLLANMMEEFRYLNVGLGLVLVFVGVKMAIREWYPIPILVSLAVIATLLGGSMLASLLRARYLRAAPPRQGHGVP